MAKWLVVVAAGWCLLGTTFAAAVNAESGPGWDEWKAACSKLPSNRALRGQMPPANLLPLKHFSELARVIDTFVAHCRTGTLAQVDRWVGVAPQADRFFNPAVGYFDQGPVKFQPFAQKLEVPAGTELFVRGDLHGDIHSFLEDITWLNREGYLSGFQIVRTNFMMLFLGDYTDRGSYGTEVLYTLLRLKNANPEKLWMARGNHEDISLIARYGFLSEAREKFGRDLDARKIARLYDFLPVVIYPGHGTHFVQANHGGMEPGYDPSELLRSSGSLRFQLLGQIRQQEFSRKHGAALREAGLGSGVGYERIWQDFVPASPIDPIVLGFMWNDFTVRPGEKDFDIDPGRAFVYGERLTRAILAASSGRDAKVWAVFRAHQHSSELNPMMRRLVASRGLFRHWQTNDVAALANADVATLSRTVDTSTSRAIPHGSVWTFNVAPDSYYGAGCGYDFDTFGMVSVAPNFSDWRIRVVNLPVNPGGAGRK